MLLGIWAMIMYFPLSMNVLRYGSVRMLITPPYVFTTVVVRIVRAVTIDSPSLSLRPYFLNRGLRQLWSSFFRYSLPAMEAMVSERISSVS